MSRLCIALFFLASFDFVTTGGGISLFFALTAPWVGIWERRLRDTKRAARDTLGARQ